MAFSSFKAGRAIKKVRGIGEAYANSSNMNNYSSKIGDALGSTAISELGYNDGKVKLGVGKVDLAKRLYAGRKSFGNTELY